MTEIVSKSSDQTNGVLDMELLHIDVLEEEEEEEDVLQGAPEREHASFSKNVLRKQRHWERKLAARKSKRKEEKLRKKLNRHSEGVEQRHLTKRVLKAVTKERLAEARSGGHKVCVDLGVSHRMSDKETSRLAAQLRRLYGANKRASKPFHLFLTSFREDSRLLAECVRMNAGFLNYAMERTERSCLDIFPPERVVYLSPDAEEALERVDHDDVYVLGGLVDESVQKCACLDKLLTGSCRRGRQREKGDGEMPGQDDRELIETSQL
ncbi:tRNA methyltransferase 10 homolog B isoform X2 [Phycodurus eques]|uniref:tRNA methyltransferase 10 homolog B isoform X2 n=1 Tax=Phycodurus eques TaxID=693459 RepID=UPI002ACDE4DC|nr:tRNA methyltransferase 10 homolog B isoform X2 [Phycodurus eques]